MENLNDFKEELSDEQMIEAVGVQNLVGVPE